MNARAHVFNYDDPRLTMTLAGRMLVHAGTLVALILFITATFLCLASTIDWVRWLGAFMLLMLIDLIIHHGDGDVPVAELADHERVELSRALPSRIESILRHAFDASRVIHTDPALELLCVLIAKRDVKRELAKDHVHSADVMDKVREFMTREEAHLIMTKKERIDALRDILAAAFLRAEREDHEFITPLDVFYGIPEGSKGLAARIFTVFDIPAR